MAAATILGIMQGIETRLATVEGLRVNYYVPDRINPPAAVVGVPPVEQYHATMANGRLRLEPQVFVLVSATLDRIGQTQLANYADPAGPLSIKAAIEGDPTLGGAVDDCKVLSFRPLGMEEVGAIGYYGGVFSLLAIATGV